jgi:hypothetical protein
VSAIRKPLVVAAAVMILLALAIEIGSRFWVRIGPAEMARPGLGITSLAAVDALLTMTLAVVASGAVGLSPTVVARTSGCVTAIVGFLTLLASLAMAFVSLGLLLLMVGLLVATPFGTLVYLAVFGSFARGPASVTLGFLLLLKMAAAIVEVLGNQYALKSKSLILLFATSIGLTFLLSFLHGLPPRFLVSITDAIGAIAGYVLAVIWAIFYLVGGASGAVNNLKLGKGQTEDR